VLYVNLKRLYESATRKLRLDKPLNSQRESKIIFKKINKTIDIDWVLQSPLDKYPYKAYNSTSLKYNYRPSRGWSFGK
jgi:hypothetical protein